MKQRDSFSAEERRYKMKDGNMTREVSKTYVTTRNYSPGAGIVELANVIVLPGYI
jgi:hypothetical protein